LSSTPRCRAAMTSVISSVAERVQRLKRHQADCQVCHGTGRSGLLGGQGFGMMDRECPWCIKDEPRANQNASAANGKARAGFAPPTGTPAAVASNAPGAGRGLCCGYTSQQNSNVTAAAAHSDPPEVVPMTSCASWESSCFIPMPRSNIEPSPLAEEMMHVGESPMNMGESPMCNMSPPAVTPQAQSDAQGLQSISAMQEDGSPTYEGQNVDGFHHGAGRETWPGGAYFEGQFLRGRKHGTGKFRWGNGSCYEGDFDSNMMSGVGVIRWQDGSQYQGQWKNNGMHGRGFFKWVDGKTYEGEYRNDVKEGKGTFRWPDGRQFVGDWCNGVQHGSGTYRMADGKRRSGTWKNGKLAQWTSPVER